MLYNWHPPAVCAGAARSESAKAFVSSKAVSKWAGNHRYNVYRETASLYARVGGIRSRRLGTRQKA
ncbi:hypothetical protein, partial [Treponema endosymbiont of Eucomonympha sp.]|uniref:hypothetical protein n=1 Tax=Treponema endosymbiont of Eucomonympha sp. TaxID=1580831 RepID=UPI001E5B6236